MPDAQRVERRDECVALLPVDHVDVRDFAAQPSFEMRAIAAVLSSQAFLFRAVQQRAQLANLAPRDVRKSVDDNARHRLLIARALNLRLLFINREDFVLSATRPRADGQ